MKANLLHNESDLNEQLAAIKCSVRVSIEPVLGVLSLEPAKSDQRENIFSCYRNGRVIGLWLGRKAITALGMTNPPRKQGCIAKKLQKFNPKGYALMTEGFTKASKVEPLFTEATLVPAKITDEDIIKDLQALLYLLTPERNEQTLSTTSRIALSAWQRAVAIDVLRGGKP